MCIRDSARSTGDPTSACGPTTSTIFSRCCAGDFGDRSRIDGDERFHDLCRLPRADASFRRTLPHALTTLRIDSATAAADAIRDMIVRGAPLIGAVGAYGLALSLDAD